MGLLGIVRTRLLGFMGFMGIVRTGLMGFKVLI
jgi:hypothetical protein